MAIHSGGGGQEGVDWDAVFRTIDQQQIGPDVARDQVGGGSGTLALQADYQPQWPTAHDLPAEPQGVHDAGSRSQGEAELLDYFDRQLGHGGRSARLESSNAPRIMGAPSGQYGDHTAEHGSLLRPSIGPSFTGEDYNVAFRAMMGGEDLGTVPPPRDRPTRGRRRSHSLGPRRTNSEGLPALGPLTGPLTSFPTLQNPQDAFPFPSPSLRQTIPYNTGPPQSQTRDPDFFALLSQAEASSSSRPSPSHPYHHSRPSTSHHRPQDGRGIKRPSISISTDSSRYPTPSNSAFPSPSARIESMTPRLYSHGHQDPTSSATHGGGIVSGDGGAQTPGAELDSEDKRTRNTLASARFRAKRKAHICEVERQITHLEGRSTTLQKQVEDLRKENGFLKDMVQLKYGLDVDKRMR